MVTLSRTSLSFVIGAFIFGAPVISWSAQPARAETARIGFTTYLRDGPSVRYRAIDEALSNEPVDILACAEGWCRVMYGGAPGYVAQATLVTTQSPVLPAGQQSCFINRIAGYHGGPDVEFCYVGPR